MGVQTVVNQGIHCGLQTQLGGLQIDRMLLFSIGWEALGEIFGGHEN